MKRTFLQAAPVVAAAPKKANISWIMTEHLGWSDLDCCGQKYIQTPNNFGSLPKDPGSPALMPAVQCARLPAATKGNLGTRGRGDIRNATTPVEKDLDLHFGFLHQAHARFQYPRSLYHHDRDYRLAGNSNTTEKTYTNDGMAEKALEFIRKDRRIRSRNPDAAQPDRFIEGPASGAQRFARTLRPLE